MNEKELYLFLKSKFLEKSLSEAKAAAIIGITQPAFNKRLKSGNLKFLEVVKIMDSLGYDLIWQKREE